MNINYAMLSREFIGQPDVFPLEEIARCLYRTYIQYGRRRSLGIVDEISRL